MYIIRLTPNHSIEHHPQGGSRKKVKSRLVQGMPTSFCKGAEQYCSVVVGTPCTYLKSLNADKSGILNFWVGDWKSFRTILYVLYFDELLEHSTTSSGESSPDFSHTEECRKSKRDHVSLFVRGKSTRTFLVLLLLLMYTWHSTTNNNRSVGNQFDAFDGTKARVEMEKQKETIHCNFPQNILVEKSINLALKVANRK